jgi:hypothetical protein
VTVLLNTSASKQQLALAVVEEILSMPLAAGHWTIDRDGGISIRLPDYGGTDWCAEVEKYSASLGLPTRRVTLPGYRNSTQFEACGRYRGIYVSVWTPQTAATQRAWGR